jgi:hypothetical protein
MKAFFISHVCTFDKDNLRKFLYTYFLYQSNSGGGDRNHKCHNGIYSQHSAQKFSYVVLRMWLQFSERSVVEYA